VKHYYVQTMSVESPVKERVTIILVTSPILSHPTTELIEKVVESFTLVSWLSTCKLLLVADGAKVGKFRPKRGQVPGEMVLAYTEYLDRVQGLLDTAVPDSIWSRTSLVRLVEHKGFGHAVLHGLMMADTEYVMVVQHDHPFTNRFCLRPVIDFMDEHQANYVCLPISTVFRHINRCFSLHQMDLRAKAVTWNEARFVPILFWYDGTHLARRKAYIKLVFEGDHPLPLGHFIEDTFSQRVMSLLREDYETWFPIFSMWMFQPKKDEETALILHLDGRNYRTDVDRLKLGYKANPVIKCD